MSLQWALSREVPADTAEIGRRVLKHENVYRQIGDHFDALFPQESEFAFLYDRQGRGALPPLLAALVTVFQMLERVPDRQAAEFVASRLDWKYALHLPLDYAGFHWTDLWAFRQRLWQHQQERLLYDRFLQQLQTLGLIQRRGQMRTDATHVLGVVERLGRLELVSESLRLALKALTTADPAWLAQVLPPSFLETYQQGQREYRLSQAQVQQRLQEAGQDGFWLLGQLERYGKPAWCDLPEVVTLRTVLEQQFPQGPDQSPVQPGPAGTGIIASPHEPTARYSSKRGQGWIGYKSQVTETCDPDFPHLIVDIAATAAPDNDAPQLPLIEQRLQQRHLLPAEWLVDQAYVSGEHLVKRAALGINLVGIPPDDTQGPPGFRQSDFRIDQDRRLCRCPAGQLNRVWSEKQDGQSGPPQILIRFAAADCQACAFFGQCTTSAQGRSLTLHPYREALLARRAEAQTERFRQQLRLRAGVEGTLSELVRVHGLRRARYRGLAKQDLQQYFTALAANLKRLAQWWTRPQAKAVATSAA